MTTNVLKTCEINGKERTEDVLINSSINFDSLLLSTNTLNGLKKCSFQKPSPIQLKAIPLGRCGFDLIVKSKSGTGKTAVFAVIGLEMLNVKKQHLQMLVIAPTREIALQGCDVINSVGAEFKDLKASCFIGGMPLEDDIKKSKSCQIAVGTPGRLKHLIQSSHLKTEHIKLFILDEADKLMESSYQSDINEIYHRLPLGKQMLALSATYPDELDKFLAKYMHTPTHVTAEMETPLLLGLKQIVCVVKSSLNVMQQMNIKIDKIVDVLSKVSFTQCLIFSNFQTRAESVSNTLNRKGWNTKFISSSQTQEERIAAIKDLKESKCKVLLSTDLTARGIDASNVDLVVNYDVPHDASTYLHRMGRAGRYGSRGICVTVAAKGNECKQLEGILGMIGGSGMKIAKMPEEIPDKIWDVDFGSFEQIVGVMPEGDCTEESVRLRNIKSSVWELKSGKNVEDEVDKVAETSIKSDENKASNDDDHDKANATEDILKLLAQGKRPQINQPVKKEKTKDTETTVKTNEGSDIDMKDQSKSQENTSAASSVNTIDILKMLSGNQINESSAQSAAKSIEIDTTKRNESRDNLDTIDVLKMLAGNESLSVKDAQPKNVSQPGQIGEMNSIETDANKANLAEDSSSKRKREDKNHTQQDTKRSLICEKNISLLNITKLLLNDVYCEDKNVTENIASYLDQIRKETEPCSETSSESECPEMECDRTKQGEVEAAVDNENVFLYAYESAVDPTKPHWSKLVKFTEEADEAEEEAEKVVNLLNCSDDYEEDSEEVTCYRKNKSSRNRKKSWTKRKSSRIDENINNGLSSELQNTLFNHEVEPHEETEKGEVGFPAGLYSYHEYGNCKTFDAMFENCSKELETNVNEIEDVDNYDKWFVQWQQQVQSVRDYVQQNVYLQEMNRYQYYRSS